MNESLEKRIERLEGAMFGDDKGEIGMQKKVDEIYNFFIGSKLAGKVVMGIIIGLGALAVAFSQIGDLLKRFLHGN